MIKDTSAALNVHETHKIHRKAAMYAILGDLLFIVLIIVFGLVPSLVVLALLLSVNPIPHGLQLAQACIFALGSLSSFSLA